VTGRIAGEAASGYRVEPQTEAVDRELEREWSRLQEFWHPREVTKDEASLLAFRHELQNTMWQGAGPLRTEEGLIETQSALQELQKKLADTALAPADFYTLSLVEKLEAANMLKLSESIVMGALARRETRGAHVRLDIDDQNEKAISSKFTLDSNNDWQMEEIEIRQND
jgi:succinate dehydrogenase/fumarate reductase flavoprotein subunit